MTAWRRIFMVFFVLSLPHLVGCSDDRGKKEKMENKGKGMIEQATDKAAKEAVDRVKVPLEQARTAADQESNRSRQLEEQERNR
jgi:hypothetical protein